MTAPEKRRGNPAPVPPPRRDRCVAGHDLTDPANVKQVQRKRGEKVYVERQCKPCAQRRAREWWAKNRGG